VKWKIVTKQILKETSFKKGFFFFYISLSNTVGMVIPRSLGIFAVRSISLKSLDKSNFKKGIFTIIYDQIFDIFIALIMLPSAMLYISKIINFYIAIIIIIFIFTIFVFVLAKYQSPFIKISIKFLIRIKSIFKKDNTEVEVNGFSNLPFFQNPKYVFLLLSLSLIRFGVFILRDYFVIQSISLNINILYLAFSFPIIQLSMILSLTPANLGIGEWSWIGLFSLFGVKSSETALFTLSRRIFIIISVLTITFIAFIWYKLQKNTKIIKD
jgi:uncharacterized protein (TIRG00374 family)